MRAGTLGKVTGWRTNLFADRRNLEKGGSPSLGPRAHGKQVIGNGTDEQMQGESN